MSSESKRGHSLQMRTEHNNYGNPCLPVPSCLPACHHLCPDPDSECPPPYKNGDHGGLATAHPNDSVLPPARPSIRPFGGAKADSFYGKERRGENKAVVPPVVRPSVRRSKVEMLSLIGGGGGGAFRSVWHCNASITRSEEGRKEGRKEGRRRVGVLRGRARAGPPSCPQVLKAREGRFCLLRADVGATYSAE